MGEATRRKLTAAPVPSAQPIPAETLRSLYPALLEVQLAEAQHLIAAQRLRDMATAYNARVAALAPGVELSEWQIDLKAGRMTRVKAAKTETEKP